MNIKDINQMSDDIFIDYFKNIFEKTPLLAKLTSVSYTHLTLPTTPYV